MSYSVKWNKQIANEIEKAVMNGLREGGEMILDASNQIAPIDEGTLINSGKVTVDQRSVNISYDTPYALRQHEDMTLQHKNGRQAKFLESAFKENIKRVLDYVAKQARSKI